MEFPAQFVSLLSLFVETVKAKPETLDDPKLAFFKEFLTEFKSEASSAGGKSSGVGSSSSASRAEVDVETPAWDPTEGDGLYVSEAAEEAAVERSKVAGPPLTGDAETVRGILAAAMAEKKLPEALRAATRLVEDSPDSVLLRCKRADILLRLDQPRAALTECKAAVELNADNGRAWRLMGLAKRRVGDYRAAAKDLALGQQIDFDEDFEVFQKFLAAKVQQIDIRAEAAKAKAKADETQTNAAKTETKAANEAGAANDDDDSSSSSDDDEIDAGIDAGTGAAAAAAGGFPAGLAGMFGGAGGGLPGGLGAMFGGGGDAAGAAGGIPGGLGGMMGLLKDPEVMALLQNPKVMAAAQDMMANPGNIGKHASDPDVMAVIAKLGGMLGRPAAQ